MQTITIGEVRRLLGPQTPPCVSIYLPAEADAGAERDRIQLARLVDGAAALLVGKLPPDELQLLLAPLRTLASEGLWRRPGEAVAAFRSPAVFTVHRARAIVPELAVVSTTFHTRPLVRFVDSGRRFYVLALTGAGAELLEGAPGSLTELEPGELPRDLGDALAGERALPERLAAVDAALSSFLGDAPAPVILAGSGAHRALYRSVSRCREILEDGIEITPGPLDLPRVLARATKLIARHGAEVHGALIARLSSALSAGAADLDLRRIARAAAQRRVAILLYAEDSQQWGRLDRETGALRLADSQRDEKDADVVDDLAEMVLLAGGDVHEVPAGSLPASAPIAAILR